MAKKRKRRKAKHLRFGRFAVPEAVVAIAVAAAGSPLGRQIISDALVHAAGVFLRKYPGPAAASAGAEAANAAKGFAHSASEAAANFMHATAERIRNDGGSKANGVPGDPDPKQRATAGRSGNGPDDFWSNLDEETIRRALVGEFERKKAKKKKAKRDRPNP